MDPQQRLVLEVAWEALEDAGQAIDKLAGTQTGVFVGICTDDYAQLHRVLEHPQHINPYYGTGNAYSFAAGRLSYVLGLQGPSMAIDTACSSSLVAIHLACQSLRQRECNLALAGGVNIILTPTGMIYVSHMRVMAADGRCKTFDAAADGYVRGEGCGIVVLKRLSDALADGDHIHALLRGSAVNQDGRSGGLTVPNGRAQEALIRQALSSAGLKPSQVSYVEAHGTGTSLGDPIEVGALGAVLCAGRPKGRPLMIGSAKTNIGHLEAAAGVAALIKVVLALRHKELPPHLHLKELNPHIQWKEMSISVPTSLTPWPSAGGTRLAGVSSFGFSGTNAHVIVEEPPAPSVSPSDASDTSPDESPSPRAPRSYLLPLSARSPSALRALAGAYRAFLAKPHPPTLRDICHTASQRRAHHQQSRLSIVSHSHEELDEQLGAFIQAEPRRGVASGQMVTTGRRCRVVFVYPGHGAQWWAMGRQLLAEEAVFRTALEECDTLIRQAAGWSLLKELMADEDESRLDADNVEITQVSLFAVQVGLTALWREWGVEPDAVVGHSMGEVAAGYASEALSLAEAVRVICARGRLLQRATAQPGAMAAVGLSIEQAREVIAEYKEAIAVGAHNGPQSCVLSGVADAVLEVVERLELDDVFVRQLRTTGVAGHSPQVEGVRAELESLLADVRPVRAKVRMVSTVSGKSLLGTELDGRYWGRNLRETVQFRRAMERLRQEGYKVYLEMSAHPMLVRAMEECLRDGLEDDGRKADGREARICWSLQRGEDEHVQMLRAAAELYSAGYDLHWERLSKGGGRCVGLPHYPWQRQRFWLETPALATAAQPKPIIIAEAELETATHVRETVEELLRRWSVEGARALNRGQLAPYIFLGSMRRNFFYVSREGRSLTALIYVGPLEAYATLVKEMLAYCGEQELQLNLLAEADKASILRHLGFTLTPCGVLQTIDDLESFALQGNQMRRLRYQVSRYARLDDCATREYVPGGDRQIDRNICEVIDQWLSLKSKPASSVLKLKQKILSGTLDPRYRLFLTSHEEKLDSLIILSPAEAKNGYLMDLEFYGPQMPPGCLEFAIVKIIEKMRSHGYSYLSLGGTFGTQLAPHPEADPHAAELFAALHSEGILNGDANFQFKSKFRPQVSPLYLCRLPGSVESNLTDVLLTLTGRGGEDQSGGRLRRAQPPAEVRAASEPLKDRRQEWPDSSSYNISTSLAPLVGRRLRTPLQDILFESRLSAGAPAFLSEHRIDGLTLLPGTAYLEMALEAAASISGAESHVLKDVAIQQLMVLPEDGTKTIQLVLRPAEAHEYSFEIFSLQEDKEERSCWSSHAIGKVSTGRGGSAALSPPDASLERIRVMCREEVNCDDHYAWLAEQGVHYGGSFRAIERLWRADGEALGYVRLSHWEAAEAAGYQFHPALLDACFQVLAAAGFDGQYQSKKTGIYLMRGLEALRLYCRPDVRLWSHAVLRRDDAPSGKVLIGDLHLFDATGRIVAEVEGLCARSVEGEVLPRSTKGRNKEALYEIRWLAEGDPQRQTLTSTRGTRRERESHFAVSATGSWLIFADERGIGETLAAQLTSRGESCLLVHAGQLYERLEAGRLRIDPARPADFQRLVGEWAEVAGAQTRYVVHLWSLNAASAERLTVAELDAASKLCCGSALLLIQSLVEAGLTALPRLWLVTQGAQALDGDAVEVAQASLWGLGRVVAVEHPEIWGGLVDLDAVSVEAAASELARELTTCDAEDNVAYRGGRRYVARLSYSESRHEAAGKLRMHGDGSYLITGGMGGLGLTVADWMVERGARRVVLVGRRGARSEREREAIRSMEDKGAEVWVRQIDVCVRAQVARLLNEMTNSGMPLRGIVHAAGVIDDKMLLGQDWERFSRVLAPKVSGAWILHSLTQHLALDFFVLFSSAASLLGPPGQASHAAANAFLDALAHHRRAQGLTALSLNWGVWDEVGVAAGHEVAARMASQGMAVITPPEGLRWLEQTLQQNSPQVAIMPVDWQRWRQVRRMMTEPPLLASLVGGQAVDGVRRNGRSPEGGAVKDVLLTAEPKAWRSLLESYLCEQTSRLTGLPKSRIDVRQPLCHFGFDSLMSVELKNQIERDWQVNIPIVNFFREPSVAQLTAKLIEQLTQPAFASSLHFPRREEAAQLLTKIDQLSDSEVDSLLASMMPGTADMR
jgi:acyl transferase domain-containing protein